MKKIISLILTVCFLLNSTVYGIDHDTYTLASGSIFSGLVDDETKDIARIRMVMIPDIMLMINSGNFEPKHTASKDSVFRPAIYYDTRSPIGDSDKWFTVKCRVKDTEDSDDLRTYMIAYCAEKIDGDYVIEVYTEEEFAKAKEQFPANIDTLKELPIRPDKESAIIDDYIYHERTIDRFIRNQIEQGHFAELRSESGRRRDAISAYGNQHGMIEPTQFVRPYLWAEVERHLDKYLSLFGLSTKSAFGDKNIVFIKCRPQDELPMFNIKGQPVRVRSHTSQNAIYFFLDSKSFDSLVDKKRTPAVQDEDYEALSHILHHAIHETGAVYRRKWEVSNGRTVNDFDRAYARLQDKCDAPGMRNVYAYIDAHSSTLQGEITDEYPKLAGLTSDDRLSLDTRLDNRDYAMGDDEDALALMMIQKRNRMALFQTADKFPSIINFLRKEIEKYLRYAVIHFLTTGENLSGIQDLDDELYFRETLITDRASGVLPSFPQPEPATPRSTSSENEQKGKTAVKRLVYDVCFRAYNANLPGIMEILDITRYRNSGTPSGVTDGYLSRLMKDLFGSELDEFFSFGRINRYEETKMRDDEAGYWQTVEDDIKDFIEADRALELTPRLAKNAQLEEEGEALEFSCTVKSVRSDREVDEDLADQSGIFERIEQAYRRLAEWSGTDTDNELTAKQLFEKRFHGELQEWTLNIHERLSGRKSTDETLFTGDADEDRVAIDIVNKVIEWLKMAQNAKIFLIRNELYVSPRTQELFHVRRGIRQDDFGVWMGERIFEIGGKLDDEPLDSERFALLLYEEAKHLFQPGKHDEIKSAEDLDYIVEHGSQEEFEDIKMQANELWREELVELPWKKGQGFSGSFTVTVGNSEVMGSFFTRLRRVLKSPAIINLQGYPGSGKTKAIDDIAEVIGEYGIARSKAVVINCQDAQWKTKDPEDLLFGYMSGGTYVKGYLSQFTDDDKRGLLVIDKPHDMPEGLKDALVRVFERDQDLCLHDAERTPLCLKNISTVLLSDPDTEGKQLQSSIGELSDYIDETIEMPSMLERGEDIALLAEYFNYTLSEEKGMPFSPMSYPVMKGLLDYYKGSMETRLGIAGKEIKGLRFLINKIVIARRELLEAYNNGTLYSDSDGYTDTVKALFSPYLITQAEIVRVFDTLDNTRDAELETDIDKIIAKTRNIIRDEAALMHRPYLDIFAPRKADGQIHEKGFFFSAEPVEQPGMGRNGNHRPHKDDTPPPTNPIERANVQTRDTHDISALIRNIINASSQMELADMLEAAADKSASGSVAKITEYLKKIPDVETNSYIRALLQACISLINLAADRNDKKGHVKALQIFRKNARNRVSNMIAALNGDSDPIMTIEFACQGEAILMDERFEGARGQLLLAAELQIMELKEETVREDYLNLFERYLLEHSLEELTCLCDSLEYILTVGEHTQISGPMDEKSVGAILLRKAKLVKQARELGPRIILPAQGYTLFTSNDIYKSTDYDTDINKYENRFNIIRTPKDNAQGIVDDILRNIEQQGLDPNNVIVQLNRHFLRSKQADQHIARLEKEAKGVKVIVVDTDRFKYLTRKPKERARHRNDIYAMMLLARHANEDTLGSIPGLVSLLNFYITRHLKVSAKETRDTEVQAYIKAIATGSIKDLVGKILSAVPIMPEPAPNFSIVSEALTKA